MADKYLNPTGLSYLVSKIKTLLSGKVDKVTGKGLVAVDSSMSSSSTNPVQNKVVNNAISDILIKNVGMRKRISTGANYNAIKITSNASTDEQRIFFVGIGSAVTPILFNLYFRGSANSVRIENYGRKEAIAEVLDSSSVVVTLGNYASGILFSYLEDATVELYNSSTSLESADFSVQKTIPSVVSGSIKSYIKGKVNSGIRSGKFITSNTSDIPVLTKSWVIEYMQLGGTQRVHIIAYDNIDISNIYSKIESMDDSVSTSWVHHPTRAELEPTSADVAVYDDRVTSTLGDSDLMGIRKIQRVGKVRVLNVGVKFLITPASNQSTILSLETQDKPPVNVYFVCFLHGTNKPPLLGHVSTNGNVNVWNAGAVVTGDMVRFSATWVVS